MAQLIEHMPRHYINATSIKDITSPIDLENEYQGNLVLEITNQFIVKTATYTLDRYEQQYGLAINPNISIEERRSRIKAKMRSIGAVTESMLRNLISAWTNASVDIIVDYVNFTVTIKFTSGIGIPTAIQDVFNALNAVLPAHLILIFVFKYRRYEELTGMTNQQLSAFTHEAIRGGVISA